MEILGYRAGERVGGGGMICRGIVGVALVNVLVAVGVVLVAVVHPGNHVGFEPRWLMVVPLVSGVVCVGAAVGRWVSWRVLGWSVCAVVVLAGVVVVMDRMNVLVRYEVWVERGMPGRGEWR